MPVTPGAHPTEVNFDSSALTAPDGREFATYQAGAAVPDPNNPEVSVRDMGTHVPNSGGVNSVAASTYTLLESDRGKLVVLSYATNPAITLPALSSKFICGILILGAGGADFTPSSAGTLNGSSTKHYGKGIGGLVYFNGSNWWFVPDLVLFYQLVQQAGTSRTQRSKLNFLGPITATDNSGNDSTDIDVPTLVGDSGSGGTRGLVPAPGAGDAAAAKFLGAGGSFVIPDANNITHAATMAGVQNESYTYAADSGAANAYSIALTPAPSAYAAGQCFVFKAGNSNTTASTLNVNSLGTKTIKKFSSGSEVDVAAGDISAGQIVAVFYDGTYFQLLSGAGGSGGSTGQTIYYASDTGSANAYAMAPTPALGSYTAGTTIAFKAANANTAASTINVSSLGTKNLTKLGAVALQGGEILAGQIILAIYDGTQFQLLDAQDRPDRIVGGVPGIPNDGQIVTAYPVAWAVTFPANFASPQAYGHCEVNPTATATFTVYKNGSSVGTISISTAGVFTFATSGGVSVSFNAGDFLKIVAPGSHDATLAGVFFTLVGTRTAAVPQTVSQGIYSWKFAYSGATAYNVNDVVSYYGNVYVCILPTTGNAPTNATYWALAVQNQPGGAITLDYQFSTTTTNSDPGAGLVRLNNATQNTATALYVNTTDFNGSGLAAVLDSLADSTNTVKGHFRLQVKGDVTKWLVFTISALLSHTGYREYTIAIVSSSASSPIANGDEILIEFSRAGDAGGGVTIAQLQNEQYTYVADSGSANAYVATLATAPASYVAGLYVALKIAHSNTGASTINVNSLGNKNIKKYASGVLSDPTAGDLTAGNVCPMIYDGTQFLLVGGGGGGADPTAEYVLGDFVAGLANGVKNSTVYRAVEVCPASPNSMNDEFDDTSGNSGTVNGLNARWTWKQQGSVPNATYSNSCAIIAWTGNNGSSHVARIIAQATPSPPYEFICKQTFHCPVGNPNFGFAGLFLFENATNKFLQNGFSSQSGALLPYMASGTVNINTGSNTGFFGHPVYFKINRTGTTLSYYISCDGISWDLIATRTITQDFTTAPDWIGVGIDPYSQPVGVNTDFFRRTI